MQGVLSFHPIDPGFFETLVEPLLRGEKVNPETFLDAARRVRRASWITLRYKLAIEQLLEELEPPPPVDDGTLWDRVRTRLERFDYKVPPLSRVSQAKIVPELHLAGRPFLVTETSADRVALLVAEYAATSGDAGLTTLVLDQLGRLDPALARGLEPEPLAEPSSDASYRNMLLERLKKLHDRGQAARGKASGGAIRPCSGEDSGGLPWQTVYLHSRAVPFWIARDVDGLQTICRAVGIEPPACLAPASGLFAGVGEELPEFFEGMSAELEGPRELGAYVAPRHVSALLAFLAENGGRMIQVATRHGEGPRCTSVLHKIRECLRFAERHGVGYLEASGILPPLEEPVESAETLTGIPLTRA